MNKTAAAAVTKGVIMQKRTSFIRSLKRDGTLTAISFSPKNKALSNLNQFATLI